MDSEHMPDTLPGPPKRKPLPPIEEWPWYKSPYLWVFVLGIIFLTLIRPCTRHVPDPPAPLGPAPTWMLPSEGLRGTALLTLYRADCEACLSTAEGIASVSRRLSRAGTPVAVVVAYMAGSAVDAAEEVFAYEPNTYFVPVGPQTEWRTDSLSNATLSGDPLPTTFDEYLDLSLVWILDQTGEIRGPLRAITEEHRSELFHRTQHVIYDAFDDEHGEP